MLLESASYEICTELANLTQIVTILGSLSINSFVLMGLDSEAQQRPIARLSGFQIQLDEIVALFAFGLAATHPHPHTADHEPAEERDANQHYHQHRDRDHQHADIVELIELGALIPGDVG